MNSDGATEGNTVPNWSGFSSGDLTATSIVYPSMAYADASDYNSGLQTINFKWTLSYFCSSNVQINVYDAANKVKSTSAANTGQFSFSTFDLNPGTSYEFEVYDPAHPNNKLYTVSSF